jgi:drug/metabolite transporter (DMT)-like permease
MTKDNDFKRALDDAPKPTNMRLRAIIFINTATFCSTGTLIAWKMAQKEGVSSFDCNVFRSMWQIVLSLIILWWRGIHPWNDIPAGWMPLLLTRSGVQFALLFVILTTIEFLPMTICILLLNLNPFWSSILGYFVNGDTFYKIEILAIAICFGLVVGIT